VLKVPVVLRRRASKPVAVLKLPVVLVLSALAPIAVLSTPVVLLKSALKPKEASHIATVYLTLRGYSQPLQDEPLADEIVLRYLQDHN